MSHLKQTSEFCYSPSIFVNERVRNSRLHFCSQYRTHHSQELVQFSTFEIINVLFLDRGLFLPVSLTEYKQNSESITVCDFLVSFIYFFLYAHSYLAVLFLGFGDND